MFTSLLNKTANISRKTLTQQAMGEVVETWSVVYSGLACRYNKKTLKISDDSFRTYKTTTTDYMFFFDSGNDIILADRIEVDSKVFLVNEVVTLDGASTAHHMQVICSLVENS